MNITAFLSEFTNWASAQPDISGVALVGSYARGAARQDSDIDLMILTTDVERYFQGKAWASLFGQIERIEEEDWGAAETLRVFYEDGGETEFNFSAPAWARIPVDSGTYRVISDGMQILFDPQDLLESAQQTVLDKTILDSRSKP